MKEEKKASVAALVFGVIIVAGIIALYMGTHIDLMFHEPKDLMELIEEEGSPKKGEYVSVGIDAAVDCYAETKHRINGIIPAGTDMHYVLWLDDGSFISIKVNGKKNIEKLDKIVNETQRYVNGNSDTLPAKYELSGVISTMDSEIEDYYRQDIRYWGIDESGYPIYYVEIDETQSKLSAWLMMGFFALIEVICVIALIKAIQEKKQEKLAAKAAAMNAPITDENNNLYR
ncbi:MAG: hypothetical protein E7257_03325 [Lachnospiraceae bacterium]|nr:hypothetical protein [Lachnospiraceae bacterium]